MSCILYDDSDCVLDHWTLPIELRRNERRSFTRYGERNEVESVSIKAGCRLTVWTEMNYRGSQYVFNAPYTQDRHETLKRDVQLAFLEDNIESVECTCRP